MCQAWMIEAMEEALQDEQEREDEMEEAYQQEQAA